MRVFNIRWLLFLTLMALVGRPVYAADSLLPALPGLLDTKTYVLRTGDLLEIRVYQQEDLDRNVNIRADGTVTLPLIETIQVAGLSEDQATEAIRAALEKDFLVNPKVTVTVTKRAERTFNILGQVKTPGPHVMTGETITLVQAIVIAGGGTGEAKLSEVSVSRVGPEGRNMVYSDLNVEKMIRNERYPSFTVYPGDTIEVPRKRL